MNEFPKVLIVGAGMDINTGSGVTLKALFSQWPVEKIAAIVTESPLNNKNYSFTKNLYLLGSSEMYLPWPASKLGNSYRISKPLQQDENHFQQPKAANGEPDKKPLDTPLKKNIRALMKPFDLNIEWFMQTEISKSLQQWINTFSPDLIYGQFSSILSIRLLRKLIAYTGKPYVIHAMDDWIENAYKGKRFAQINNFLFMSDIKEIFRGSSGNFTICAEMAEDYQQKFSVPFTPYMNMVNVEEWMQSAKNDWTISEPVKIRYGGRIGWSIKDSIFQFAAAVSKINNAGLKKIRFEVFSPQFNQIKEEIEKFNGVYAYDMISRDHLQRSLTESDFLLVAYDFDETSRSKAAYSMPTKIVEYMASGTPIIVFAPADLAVSKYAQRDRWAEVITDNSVDIIIAQLFRVMNSEAARKVLSISALETCRINHEIQVQSKQFYQNIINILSNTGG